MDLQLYREATQTYHKSANTLYQVFTNLWINPFEEIVLPKATIENNIKAMMEIKEMLPELFQTQV